MPTLESLENRALLAGANVNLPDIICEAPEPIQLTNPTINTWSAYGGLIGGAAGIVFTMMLCVKTGATDGLGYLAGGLIGGGAFVGYNVGNSMAEYWNPEAYGETAIQAYEAAKKEYNQAQKNYDQCLSDKKIVESIKRHTK